jgi:3-carboxy-cis,cis-muconate cycloisomerase
MRANLELTHGQILAEAVSMALGERIGRIAAHGVVEAACRRATAERRHLRDVLTDDAKVRAHLSEKDLDRLFDPGNYTGLAELFVERALAACTRDR